VSFTVIIPARLASTRLPNKPLADIGGAPMVVRVAQAAAKSQARSVVVAADDARTLDACAAHGISALLTRADHASGSDRLAEACAILGMSDDEVVVNVQGDEPFIEPDLIDAVAGLLTLVSQEKNEEKWHIAGVGTASVAINSIAEFNNPNVVKVVCDGRGNALYFSRAPVPWWRDGSSIGQPAALPPSGLARRHIGIYSYRVGTLRAFAKMPASDLERVEALEQLRLLHHGEKIAVYCAAGEPAPGVDTAEDLALARALWQQKIDAGVGP
jgi:3-deoxy-manno-octulosonate cytidylyltransferase (CMP-KDO synthetase)